MYLWFTVALGTFRRCIAKGITHHLSVFYLVSHIGTACQQVDHPLMLGRIVYLMALDASDIEMFPVQGKSSVVVIKVRHAVGAIMAKQAVLVELLNMLKDESRILPGVT